MVLEKGFRQFLVKTGVFLGLFILISFAIGQRIVASSLLYGFKFFIYGGMGKVLLFSIFGFVLFYRDRLLKLSFFKREKVSLLMLELSLLCVIGFYILASNGMTLVGLNLNIGKFSPSVLGIFLFHLLFLAIFVFLIIGIFGLNFLRDFFRKFKRELLYFFIFGVIVYSLMYYVWRLWPFLSLIVVRVTSFLLGLVGDVVVINQYTFSFGGFAAEIGEACSGVYSIFIFSSLYLFAVILDWGKLDRLKVVLVFVPAIVGAFFVNVFRVFLLFVIGAYISEEIAIGLYHSYVGMVFFLVYFSVFWFLFYDWARVGK
ncbi:exosortase/archaeosortase family protein [archaeon]|nr:exosortase/archaeosortase family protein [archaeon]